MGWLLREMTFDGARRLVAGLGTPRVHPAHRGRGIASTMLSVAVEHARAAGTETALLLCRSERTPPATRPGWRRMTVPVTFRQPDGPRLRPLDTLTYDLTEGPPPALGIDLRGLPF